MERIHERNERRTWATVARKARENVAYVAAFRDQFNRKILA